MRAMGAKVLASARAMESAALCVRAFVVEWVFVW
jgi:hypothetical protein